MRDEYGRVIDYIRISLTDRCNLRCVYCMPEEGVEPLKHSDILSFEEILRIVRALAELDFHKVKLTGGEPLVRKHCDSLLKEIKQIPGIQKVTLTTNGVLLEEQIDDLVQAGLDATNISLDTMDREEFARITRRDQLERVQRGIEAALAYPELPVKINCVPTDGNAENLIRMAGIAKDTRAHVRFIEMMPIGMGREFPFRSEESILEILKEAYGPYTPDETPLGYGPGHYYSFSGFKGKIGFISAVSHKFCDKCNRVRLTADGYLKACLQYQDGTDLKTLMRNGCSEEELVEAIRQVLLHKPAGHNFHEAKESDEEIKMMAQIGG